MAASSPPQMTGINIAGGEFNSQHKPGVFGKEYIYPSANVGRPFLDAGMTAVRVPLLWERIQPKPMQPLSDTELRRLDDAVQQLSGFRTIILDVHNYGRLNGVTLDKVDDGAAKFADLWTRLAQHYARNGRVAFGLMNEPNAIPATAWRAIADKGVQAIRAAGARNLILVPGANWTGAHSWSAGAAGSNATAFAGFRDPGKNFLFDMHQYLDPDNAGIKPVCVDAATVRQRMAGATAWLRQTGNRALLGEFGAASNPGCLASLDALLGFLRANADVWAGWTYWAAGAWWGKSYPFNVQPDRDGTPKPQMSVLIRYTAGGGAK